MLPAMVQRGRATVCRTRVAAVLRYVSTRPLNPNVAAPSSQIPVDRPVAEKLDATPIDHWADGGMTATEEDAAQVLERRGRSFLRNELHDESQFYPDTFITDPLDVKTSVPNPLERANTMGPANTEDPPLGRFQRTKGYNMESTARDSRLFEDYLGGTASGESLAWKAASVAPEVKKGAQDLVHETADAASRVADKAASMAKKVTRGSEEVIRDTAKATAKAAEATAQKLNSFAKKHDNLP